MKRWGRGKIERVKDYLKQTSAQVIGILLAALAAGLISAAQSLLASGGVCPAPALSPVETGFLGGALKMAFTPLTLLRS